MGSGDGMRARRKVGFSPVSGETTIENKDFAIAPLGQNAPRCHGESPVPIYDDQRFGAFIEIGMFDEIRQMNIHGVRQSILRKCGCRTNVDDVVAAGQVDQ